MEKKRNPKWIFTTVIFLTFLIFSAASLGQVKEITCDELSKIKITDSNRETIIQKYKSAIYRCAGITREDGFVLSISELPNIAKYGAISNVPSKTIGDLINELNLIKTQPEYEDTRELAVFVFENIDKKIDVKDKQKGHRALTLLALQDRNKVNPDQLIDYIFSPACKGLTYQQGYMRFLEQQKKEK